MRPAGIRRDGMRRKKFLKTLPRNVVNGSSYMPPKVDAVFEYRARARAIDPDIVKMFGLDEMKELGDPRMMADALRMRLRDLDAYLLENPTENICLHTSKYKRVFLLYNKQRTLFKLLEITWSPNVPPKKRESLGFDSREHAMRAFEEGPCYWQAFSPLVPEDWLASP